MSTLRVDVHASIGQLHLEVALSTQGPLALVGPNGAGKSSLLRLLAGALPSTGTVEVAGRKLESLPPEARGVGYLPQSIGLFPHLSAVDNVAYGLSSLPRPARRAGALAVLERLGAGHLAPRRPRSLSGGEAQRVALARALAPSPRLLLLDEPTAALDVTVRSELRAVLAQELRAPGRVAVFVTHDLRDLVAWSPTIALLVEGRMVEVGGLDGLRRSTHPFLRELLSPLGPPAHCSKD